VTSSSGRPPALTANARRVLERRYLRPGETPAGMFERVAGAVAAAEGEWDGSAEAPWKERFLEALTALDFLPNSPTLMNAGTELGQLAACASCCPSGTRWRRSSTR